MINGDEYLVLSTKYKALLKRLKEKVNKSIMLSIGYYDKTFKNYILNYYNNPNGDRIIIYPEAAGIESFLDFNETSERDYFIGAYELTYVDFLLKNKDDLSSLERNLLRSLHKRIMPENNLAINYFLRGAINPHMNARTIAILGEIADVIGAVLSDRSELDKLLKDDMFLLYINKQELAYSLYITNDKMFLPRISYPMARANLDLVSEIKFFKQTDYGMQFSICYTNNLTGGSRPLVLLGYGKDGEAFLEAKLLDINKNDVKKILWSQLIELFEKYGLPKELIINDRELYSFIKKTLEAVNIRATFNRHSQFTNNYIGDLELSLYSYKDYTGIENKSLEGYNDFLHTANKFLNMICLEGYNPVNQKIVDNLEELYDFIIDYTGGDFLDADYEDYDNNLVS